MNHAAQELSDDGFGKARVDVDNVLNDIVSKGVLNESQALIGDFCNQLDALGFRSVIDTTLENATAVSVGGHFDAVCCHCIVDELFGGISRKSPVHQ